MGLKLLNRADRLLNKYEVFCAAAVHSTTMLGRDDLYICIYVLETIKQRIESRKVATEAEMKKYLGESREDPGA